jgi:hypothetical protein
MGMSLKRPITKHMSKKWNASIQFPTDSCFINRVTEAKFSPSKSSGQPMITLEMEVVSPETYDIGGEQVEIAGIKTTQYYTTTIFQEDGKTVDEEATREAYKRVFVSGDSENPALFERFGLDGRSEDPNNPNVKQLEGLCVYTQMSPDVEEQRKSPTKEQLDKAKKAGVKNMREVGDIMKNPITGKAMVRYWPKVREIFGIAPSNAAANKPY